MPFLSRLPVAFASGLNPEVLGRFALLVRACTWAVILIAVTVLAGWVTGTSALIRFGTSFNGMAANTAIAFLLSGAGLLLHAGGHWRRAHACFWSVLAIGGATLFEYLGGVSLGIDELLFRTIDGVITGAHPGRMAQLTAVTLALLGGAQLLLQPGLRSPAAALASQLLAVTSLIAGSSRAIGYVYGAAFMDVIVPFVGVAIPTSIAFILLSAGTLCALPDRGLMRSLASAGPGGQLSRRSLPFLIGVPLLAGYLRIWAERAGYVSLVSGVESMVFAWIATFTALHFWNARALDRAHEAGRKAEEVRQRFFGLSLDMLCIAHADGYFKQVAPAITKILGWTPEEFTARPWVEFVHPDDVERTLAEVRQQLATQKPVLQFENRYRHKDGSYRTLSWRSMPQPDGFMFGVARDVTDRRHAERARELLTQRLALAQRAAGIGVWDWDVRTNHIVWDERCYELYGRQPGTPVNYEVWKAAVHPDDFAAQEAALQQVVSERGRGQRRFRIRRPDGEIRYMHADEIVVLDDHGQVASVVGVNMDITDAMLAEEHLRRARDEAVQATRAKSEFVANMSHEIRTPMNGVLGMTAALADTSLTQRQKEIADAIQFSAESLLNIINDILDFSKAEAGKMKLEQIEFDANDVAERAMEVVADRARNKQLELVSFVDPALPRGLRGDPARLHQVLLNLLSNALKFTERGEVALSIDVVDAADADTLVRFSVRDTGIGIAEAARRALFQPFTQADASMTRKYGGTGLGLVISKQLVELMGGEIGVDSELGKGSTFWFTARLGRIDASTADEPSSLRGARALLVDDNETARSALAQKMSAWGVSVDQASSAAEALERIERAHASAQPYEFAVIDQRMPEVDGLELARRIQRRGDRGMHVVLMQAERGANRPEVLRDAGVGTLLTKPIRLSDFYNSLATHMGAPQAPAQVAPVTPVDSKAEGDICDLRVLVAEDNPVNQLVARHQLGKLGLSCDFASNGQEALEASRRTAYDVILMDCQMPVMDGYLATAEIRRRAGTSRRPWIVAMTAHAMPEDRQKCLASGMDDYISKPASAAALRSVLKRRGEQRPAPAPAVDARQQTVNLAHILEAANGDPAFVHELAELYVSQTQQQLERLRAAVAARRVDEIGSIAHRCKGGSVSCGVERLGSMFKQMECLASQGKVDEACAMFGDIEAEFGRARDFLERSLPAAAAV